ncbi:Arginine transport system permease protein ArtQ [Pelotomaculum sp. FP]|uniref:amino acid ABC transporter permease n=1 Tax=Pelotomaculum sp. FP TaxID=261474 RepID=UPI001065870D|nr:amino acid ABC transporter permease [Pelotomaculum sp. FP]TEB15645.1 Arginine transport system permease protein ArtQ [Pelotomaculum sp. FP]
MHFLSDLITYGPFFFKAMQITVLLTAASITIGMAIGLFVALLKISKRKLLNRLADLYIGLIRGTPLIVQLFFVYFGLAEIVDFGQFWSASIALAVHSGAYIAEIFRAGIQSIDRGQMEAARSLGMSYPLAMRRIILPQAFKRVIPPLGNQFIIGLKDSSLAAFIAMDELFHLAQRFAASTFRSMEFYAMGGLYYLFLITIFTLAVNALERRLKVDEI